MSSLLEVTTTDPGFACRKARSAARTALLLVLAALVVPAAAVAADPPPPPPPPLQTSIDFGLIHSAGNTEVTTFSAGEKTSYLSGPWTLTGLFSAIYGRTSGETTASHWQAGGRVDRAFSPRFAAYGGVGWNRDRFAGIDRRFDEGAGVAYKILPKGNDLLDVEGGLSFTQQRSILDVTDNFVAARAAALYKHLFTKSAYFQQTFEALENLQETRDLRVNAESALVAPLSKRFALKVAYAVHYDRLPEPGFESTDRMLTTSLQIAF